MQTDSDLSSLLKNTPMTMYNNYLLIANVVRNTIPANAFPVSVTNFGNPTARLGKSQLLRYVLPSSEAISAPGEGKGF